MNFLLKLITFRKYKTLREPNPFVLLVKNKLSFAVKSALSIDKSLPRRRPVVDGIHVLGAIT